MRDSLRYVDSVSLHELGLTQEEIAFLLPAAEAEFAVVSAKIGYSHKDAVARRKSFTNYLSELSGKNHDEAFAIKAQTLFSIVHGGQPKTVNGNLVVETVLDADGLGLKHSSYGAVALGNPSGSHLNIVGAATLSQYAKSMKFSFASVHSDRDSKADLHPESSRLIELTFSAEQLSMLIRADKGVYTPCGLNMGDGHWNDLPPSTNYDRHGSVDFLAQVSALMKPLEGAINVLQDMVKQGASKKADYQAMIDQSHVAAAEYAKVTDAILALGMEKGAQVSDNANRQFVAEMNQRLGQLNLGHIMDELLGLTHG
jgi:hypothetical protein